MTVHIAPLPEIYRGKRFRPRPAPVFGGKVPTRDEIELAIALFEELDPESQAWYGGEVFVQRLRDRL